MARRTGSTGSSTVDYRHPDEKRTNIPPAKMAGEGQIPKVQKVRYYYSPHLQLGHIGVICRNDCA